ncbi:MAG TPA: molybdenum cofactor biosynthesis protein MoaE [Terrimicrobiaceae bacterium]|nr:molybdenum cofactor biosynthesis protein MoaE [Terrimicrobiaceae bacterium]
MTIDIVFTDQAITERAAGPGPGMGALVEFHGVVRDQEAGRTIAAIAYEVYQPMAERVIAEIVRELAVENPCESVRIVHRFGNVPAGEASIYVAIASAHRGEAFRLLDKLMTRLKSDAPIWKAAFLE